MLTHRRVALPLAALFLSTFNLRLLASPDSPDGHDCFVTDAKDSNSDARDDCKHGTVLAYVANEFSDAVSVIDTHINQVVATITIPETAVGLSLSPSLPITNTLM
jgi:YVTN family beta-propeller protein